MSDAAKRFHESGLGMVVSIPALIEADCFDRLPIDDHRAFVDMLERDDEGQLRLSDIRALFQAYADNTGDPSWTDIEIPPYTTPETPAEKALCQKFENVRPQGFLRLSAHVACLEPLHA